MKTQEHEITYLDTYCEGGYCYGDYVDWCEANEEVPAVENSDRYWEWISWQIDDDIECFFDNLKYEKGIVNEPCVISGRLGLWWGRPEIEPVECEDLASAVRKCWSNCDYVRVTGLDGVVYVEAMHHDGTNRFEIRPLTEKGAEMMDEGKAICIGNHWHTGKYPKYLY